MVQLLSRAQLLRPQGPGTIACQAPLFMGFSRQEYWSRLPFPPPGDLPDPGIKRAFPALQAASLSTEPPREVICIYKLYYMFDLYLKDD